MVGVVFATHGHLALSFLEVAEAILGKQKAVVGVRRGDGRKEISENLIQAVSRVLQTDGVLILTGIFGESNCKLAAPYSPISVSESLAVSICPCYLKCCPTI